VRFVILHYHLLKNAGSSVEELLKWNFARKYRRFDSDHRDYAISNAELLDFLEANPEIQAVSSHQLYDPVPLVRGYIFLDLCFLRDPLERIRSTYDFFRAKPAPGDPISDLASRLTLAEFIAELIENYPWMVTDVQTNQLANGLINDPPKGVNDLDRATRRVLNTSLLGVVDRFTESIAAMEHATRMIFPGFNQPREPENVSRGMSGTLAERHAGLREECGDEMFCKLVRLNQLDFELLRRARAELDRRLKVVDDLDDRLAALAGQREYRRLWQKPAAPIEPPPTQPRRSRRGFGGRLAILKILPRFRHAALFDADYYRRTNPDLAGSHPLLHFLTRGAFQGRNPHPLIDLAHFVRTGDPHPLFDSKFYLRKNPDVAQARMDPFAHYLLHGAKELRKPHPWFDVLYYVEQCPEALENPLAHFLENCAANPHPLFDCGAYLREHPGIGENPLVHLVRQGAPLPAGGLEVSDIQLGARVWQDEAGRTGFEAPAHMRPFLLPLRYPQLDAQRL